MKGREIIKRAVVSLSEAAEVGRIDNIVFDREARMAALVIAQRGHKGKDMVSTEIGNVHALGRDAVTIDASEALEGSEKVEELHSSPNLRQLLGCRVITEGGIFLGIVRDLILDAEARRITDFELAGRGVLGHLRGDLIPATGHLRFGSRIVIVPNQLVVRGRARLEPVEEPAAPVALLSDIRQSLNATRVESVPASNQVVAKLEGDGEEEGLQRAVGT